MESGEKELRKAFEEVTTNNVRAILDHANSSRKMVRELEEKVLQLEELLRQYDNRFATMQNQITNLQAKLYRGGS